MKAAALPSALPFFFSLGLIPLALVGMTQGGWTVLLLPLASWGLFSLLDAVTGLNEANPDPDTADSALRLHRLVTLVWFPIQFALL